MSTHSAQGHQVSRQLGLDVMRACAILMVLFGHQSKLWGRIVPSLSVIEFGGLTGVEMFFVLSGFLIGGLLVRDLERSENGGWIPSFWARRWMRTLPLYYVFLGVNILILVATGTPNMTKLEVSRYFVFIQNLTFPHLGPAGTDLRWFGESWSLAVEEWFYLSLPPVMWACTRVLGPRRGILLALAVLAGFSIGCRILTLEAFKDLPWRLTLRQIVILRLDALTLGCLGAWIRHYHPIAWKQARLPALIAGVVVSGLALTLRSNPGTASPGVLRVFGYTAIDFGYALFLPFLSTLKASRGSWAVAIEKLSLWSYSMYLCQLPIYRGVTLLLGQPSNGGMAVVIALVQLAAVIACSSLTYRLIEVPFLKLRDRHFKAGAPIPSAIAQAAPTPASTA